MSFTEIQLYSILKNKLGEQEAEQLASFIKQEVKEEVNNKKDIFLTKEDKIDLMKSIYLVGLVQFIAIVGSVIGILNFMLK
jgi:hypothetical protein